MDFELNLLENSYDYLNESLGYYKKIGYDETHDPDRDTIEKKIKWKTTFLLLVQAIELLIKEKLSRINPILIYSDIDQPISQESKTITYKKSLDRLTNLQPNILEKADIQFLIKCGEIRNECVHFKIKLNSIDIKKKYCKLFELYMKLHSKFFNKKYVNEKYTYQIDQILKLAKEFIVFRGVEYTKKGLRIVQKDLQEGQQLCYLYNSKEAYERIKYGNEADALNKFAEGSTYLGPRFYTPKYCGDCLATHGEYHMTECDWEMCPKCGKQLLSCDCFSGYCNESLVNEKFGKNIKIL